MTIETETKIISLYCGGATYAEVRAQTQATVREIAQVLKRNGIQPRPRGRRPRRKRVGV